MSDRVGFVQFVHPGGEHKPDKGGDKSWNPTTKPHARKFLELDGRWLEGERIADGRLRAWAEWEPESKLIPWLSSGVKGHPQYLWDPYWVRRSSPVGYHNTDPFIYDGFYYTDCKQEHAKGLKSLARGSVIVFGSATGGDWVLDTVLVVRDIVDHNVDNYKEKLHNRVPNSYWDVTLDTTYPDFLPRARRLYIGATHREPINGMYSFFPCIEARGDDGFLRPSINLPNQYFTRNLLQGMKGHAADAPSVAESEIKKMWLSVVEQVKSQGLNIGVEARSPRQEEDASEQ